ncbi:NACHT domain-containing protein [Sphingobacterium bambusae]|uniref:NACHT domain-containing protein n=1 Tax=Sphingobacterium bambusae TaxID=662858 RepID=A0ABW6BGX5_9SPHI|nr:NACHT domain-containing protein [Sphingobacterium bambusae]WPL49410.1 NACHT domain-containing protein [Sphingobacterium bambusae]
MFLTILFGIPNFLKSFRIDFTSVALTVIAIPLLMVLRKVVIKYVKDWGEYAIDGMMYFISRHIKQSVASSLSLKRYCKLQLGNEAVKYLNVPSTRDLNIDIDKIFVNLTISYNDENESEFTHNDFLTVGNRIKVMGDPGAGKSSLIKRVFRNNCKNALKKPSKSKLPILLELKNVIPPSKIKNYQTWLYDYIKAEISKNKVYKIEDCFENYAQNKGLLILLDGLDEVSSTMYTKLADCINGLSSHLRDLSEHNSIILTMRTQFYQQIKWDYSANFPHSCFLKPFSPSDIYDFLTKWNFEKDRDRNISRVYSDLTDKPTLRDMCSNPLILSMYVAEDQITKGSVSPESRTQFYKKITEELIIKRRLKQKSNIPGAYSSLKEQRERILGKIAYDHLINIEQSSNSLKFKNAIKTIKDILACDNLKAELVFDEIARETGLITEERYRESFRFIHLTFCEFLAAFEISQGMTEGWNQLLKLHKKFYQTAEGKSRLIEVIPFAAGLFPRIQREQILYDISKLEDETLMSRCFLETKLYNHKSWSTFITSSKKNLLAGHEGRFGEKWLQDLHLFNVVVRDANLSAESLNLTEAINLNEFYKTLLENEKISLNQILGAYANQDAAAVFRLAEMSNIDLKNDFPTIIINNAHQLPFLALVKEKLVSSNLDEAIEWSTILAEAALEKKLVSLVLNEIPIDTELEKKFSEFDLNLWYQEGLVKKSFLSQCLSLALKSNQKNIYFKHLSLLSQLKTPSEVKFKILTGKYFLLCLVILILTSSVIILPVLAKSDEKSRLVTLFLLMIFYSGSIYILNYRIYLRSLYDLAMNLENTQDRPTWVKKIDFLFPTAALFKILLKSEYSILNKLQLLRGNNSEKKH